MTNNVCSNWSYHDLDRLNEQFKHNYEQRQLMAQQSAVKKVDHCASQVFDRTQPAQPQNNRLRKERPISPESKKINAQIINFYKRNDIDGIVRLFEENKDAFNAVNIATTLHRIAKYYEKLSETEKASMLNDPYYLHCIDDLQKKVAEKIEECEPYALSNIAWAFTTFNRYDQALFNAIATASIDNIDDFSHQSLSTTAWAFATLHRDHEGLFNAIATASIGKINTFNSLDLTQLAWAFAKLNKDHEDLFNAIATASIEKIGNFPVQKLATTAWAFVVVKHYNESLFAAINKRLQSLNLEDIAEFHDDNLLQIHHVFLVLHIEYPSIRLNFPKVLEDRIKQMLREMKKTDSSKFHEEVKSILRHRLSLPSKSECFEDGFFLDIALLDMSSTVIEVDGPSHFIKNTHERLGNDLLRDRILLANHRGRKILHVPYYDWYSLQTEQQKEKYLEDLLVKNEYFLGFPPL